MSFEAELLTIDETTALLGISRMTLWRATHSGDLHPVVVPGSGRDGAKRYPKQDLVDLLTGCTVGAERKEGDVVEHQQLGRLTPLKAFALANGIPWRGFTQAAREERFEHILWNGRRYMTDHQQALFLARNTVTVREDDELDAERARIERQRSRRSSSRRGTTSRAAA